MPPINRYKCDSCDLQLPSGWGGYKYVTDESGNRIVCRHPGEDSTVGKVIAAVAHIKEQELWKILKSKTRWWWSSKRCDQLLQNKEYIERLIEERTGYNSDCFCRHCLKTCELDLGDDEKTTKSWRYYYHATKRRDKRECPHCGVKGIFTVFELIGNNCPKCLKGIIVEVETGAWA